jgi:hypothetical protein
LNIPYRSGTILGTELKSTIGERSIASWSKTTALLKKQAAEYYLRDLPFPQRITYVHAYLYARIWYNAQIYEPPEDCLAIYYRLPLDLYGEETYSASRYQHFTDPRTKEDGDGEPLCEI